MMNKIRRANKRDFFIAQNMIFDLNISEHAKITYLYLCRCADDESQAFPSYNTIARKCSFSKRTAMRTIQDLEEIGLLSVEKRQVEKSGKPVNTSNLYTLYDSPSHHPSDTQSLPLVTESHHPSDTQSPYKYPKKNTNSFINTQSINQSKEDGTDRTDGTYIPKNKKSPSTSDQAKATNDVNKKTYSLYKEIIAQNIEYANLKEAHPHDNMLEDLFELIVEVVTSSKETIRVNQEDRPTDIVKATYLKLNASDIEYVMSRMKENTTKASNIRAYMLTALYNAPKTKSLYYSNLVQHDLAQ